jgi:hypothetical protein
VKKYLAADAPAAPPSAPSRVGTQPRKIDAFTGVVDGWLRRDLRLRASVIYERLVAEYGFGGHYQRVKMYVAQARPRIAAELGEVDENRLVGLHRRFETVPGAQAQVDWGDEGGLLGHVGVAKVYSFHMVLSYSRDPFCCFTIGTDLGTFWACHRRAFAHFGGVPARSSTTAPRPSCTGTSPRVWRCRCTRKRGRSLRDQPTVPRTLPDPEPGRLA